MTAISTLFFVGRPTAIAGSVRTVVVDAVDAVKRAWSASHVGEEVGVIIPAPVNNDASFAIILPIFWFGRRSASLTKAFPRDPFRRQAVSMLVIGLAKPILRPTSARLRFSGSQISPKAYSFIAAITSAMPTCLIRSNASKSDDGKSLETLAHNINNWVGHNLILISWEEQNVNSV